MTRDMDLVRELLLLIDRAPEPSDLSQVVQGLKSELGLSVIDYHIRMMVTQAGLLTGTDVEDFEGPGWLGLSLTWQGHEFLDQVRDEVVWRKARDGAAKVGGFSISLLADLAKAILKAEVQRRTGIDIS